MLALVSVLFALARGVSMWVILVPLGLICVAAMGLGLALGVTNRGLPYLPKTRRVHSFLLALVAPLAFMLAVEVVPKNATEQRDFQENARRTAAAQAEAERQSRAQLDCRVYVYQRLQVPSSADFSHSTKIFSREEGGYLVRGWVEAQNAFGAKLRRQYECIADAGGHLVSGRILE